MPLATATTAATAPDTQRPASSSQTAPASTSSAPAIDPNALNENKKKRGRHKPRNRQGANQTDGGEFDDASAPYPHGNDRQQSQDHAAQSRRGPRRRRPAPASVANQPQGSDANGDAAIQSGRSTPHAPRTAGNGGRASQNEGTAEPGGPAPRAPPRGGGRRRNINAKLTEEGADNRQAQDKSDAKPAAAARRAREPKADNLTNRLIDSLRTPPYADCPICFNSIHPAQPIWSCTPDSHRGPVFGKCLTTFESLSRYSYLQFLYKIPTTTTTPAMRNAATRPST